MAEHSVIRVAQRGPHHPALTGSQWQGYTERELSGDLLVIKVQDRRGCMLLEKGGAFKHALSKRLGAHPSSDLT